MLGRARLIIVNGYDMEWNKKIMALNENLEMFGITENTILGRRQSHF